MKLRIALLAAAGALALSSAANAQDDGYYGALGFGYTLAEDSNDFESSDAYPAAFNTDFDLDSGINIYGALGKYLPHGFRGELELATRGQDVDEMPGDGLGFAGFGSDGSMGDITVNTLMANIYKDFALSSRITPYIGAGLGAAVLKADIDNTAYTSPAATAQQPYMTYFHDVDTKVAGQLMAGLEFDLAPSVDFDARYRYLLTDTFEYESFINGPYATAEGQYQAQEVTFGLRWNFGATAPVAEPEEPVVTYQDCWDGSRVVSTASCPPVPPEEPTLPPEDLGFVVYFDWDKSNLTGAAQELISAKSSQALQYDIQGVTVQGNTDTSGSVSYNNALSARRADVVADSLVDNGIPAGLITTQALGESNLAEPTRDGVREPLNRRTEVDFDL